MEIAVDLGLAVILFGLTYTLATEGLWGSALMFFNILFASFVAFNFYEPVAALMTEKAGDWSKPWADLFCLALLFMVPLVILRLATDNLAPTMIRFPNFLIHLGRFSFAFGGAAIATTVMLMLFYSAPVHKRAFTVVGYDTKPPFGMGLDHRFLAFFQYVTGTSMSTYNESYSDPYSDQFNNRRVFDPQGRWLIDHEDARPVGDGWREATSGSGTDSSSDSDETTNSGGGGQGFPGGQGGDGPGIPGGTAGAASGLAPTNNGF